MRTLNLQILCCLFGLWVPLTGLAAIDLGRDQDMGCEEALAGTSPYSDRHLYRADLAVLKNLLFQGRLKPREYERILSGNGYEFLLKLRNLGHLSADYFAIWSRFESFGDYEVGPLRQMFQIKSEPYAVFEGAINDRVEDSQPNVMIIRDLEMNIPVAFVTYRLKGVGGDTVKIMMMQTRRGWRGMGLQEKLLNTILEKHERVSILQTELSELNEEILDEALKNNLSEDEALEKTPAYKLRMKLGFTKMKLIPQPQKHQNSVIYFLEAKRP